jgi:hypothetical protein
MAPTPAVMSTKELSPKVRPHGPAMMFSTKPMRNRSKNSNMLPTTAAPMSIFWRLVRAEFSIWVRVLSPVAAMRFSLTR